MSKDTTKKGDIQEKNLFSFSDVLPDKKIQVDFNAPDLSSNGGLGRGGLREGSSAERGGRLSPDDRSQLFGRHSYEEMVCQRVGQIMCGYEDANDCDRLRHEADYAECRLHNREKDICKIQFLSTPSAP